MTSTAYIHYSADVQGIKLDRQIELNIPCIDSLTLKMPNENRINFSFVVSNPVSLDQVCRSTKEIAKQILDVFSFYYNINIKVGCLSLENAWLENVDVNGSKNTSRLMQGGVTIGGTFSRTITVRDLDTDVTALINFPSDNRKIMLCRQFRFAIQSEDVITRYMCLYNILLLCTQEDGREEQPLVDEFIRDNEPGVEESQRPDKIKKKVMETVYTKLRNEIAHTRKNVRFEVTSKEIESKVNCLQSLTRRAIEQL